MKENNKPRGSATAVLVRNRRRGQLYDYILERYREAHPELAHEPLEPHRVSEWACKRGIYNKPPLTMQERLTKELSRWLGAAHFTDPQGRNVKANHAVTVEVMTPRGRRKISRWLPLFEAPPEHIKTSFQQRRRSLFGDARQLHLDWESYNENNHYGTALPPMNFDLNEDILESKFPTDYPSEAPEDLDEDDDL